MILYQNELPFREEFQTIAGVDEAGRGPLAGPVVIAAVILDPAKIITGLNDSKKLSEQKREELFFQIQKNARAYSLKIISPVEVDELNILAATMLGMERAVNSLAIKPDLSMIDGNRIPEKLLGKAESFVKGDGRFASIAAASILAKVTRDSIMKEYHKKYPEYNFQKNKGYPTKEHLEALRNFGITPIHRKSYKPVYELTLNLDE